jgi:hypothetical protein
MQGGQETFWDRLQVSGYKFQVCEGFLVSRLLLHKDFLCGLCFLCAKYNSRSDRYGVISTAMFFFASLLRSARRVKMHYYIILR